ncbi:MAG: hypothetical protein JW776_04220 [Candidatus Lokiarchaeota archaeon]|nr:hypothetical protein [Candidatus Lokiarchaeota archaeon]
MTDDYKRRNISGSISLPSLLLIVFIIMKLTGVIDWSWLWVLSPLWIGAALALLFFLVIGIILLSATLGMVSQSARIMVELNKWFRRKERRENEFTEDKD